jgi:hypothetical protein
LRREIYEELKKNLRTQAKGTSKVRAKIREKIVLFVYLLCTNTCNIQQNDARPTPSV